MCRLNSHSLIRQSGRTTVAAKSRVEQGSHPPRLPKQYCAGTASAHFLPGPGPILCSVAATILRANFLHTCRAGQALCSQTGPPSSSSGPQLPSSISFLLWAPKPWLSTTTSAWWRNGWVPNSSFWHPQSLRLLLSLVELDFPQDK